MDLNWIDVVEEFRWPSESNSKLTVVGKGTSCDHCGRRRTSPLSSSEADDVEMDEYMLLEYHSTSDD